MEPLEFSERLRRVLADAREEATRLEHEHLGTEHLLLALLRAGERDDGARTDAAIDVLDALGVDRLRMREVLEQTVHHGRARSQEPLAYTSRARAVLELAMAEARVLKHDVVRTEHLLVGLAREERGIAAQILLDHGVTVEKARAELARRP
jgi:ATP-dependent Clp protease ATP-binding subunit ClpC